MRRIHLTMKMERKRNRGVLAPLPEERVTRVVSELGRREFLLGGLATAGITLLAGCGGGAGSANAGGAVSLSPTSLILRAAKGRLVLPAGSNVKITEVMNLYASGAPYPDNSFDFASAAETPLLTAACGPKGGAVLFGLLQQGNAQLSAHSTAIVLAHFVLGVGVHLAEIQSLYLAEIGRAASLTTLENAVAAAIVARGEGWLDPKDSRLVAALTAIQTELSAQALSSRGVILDKTGIVSGLQINADGAGSMTVTNTFRRRSYLYVDRVAYKDKNGNSIAFQGPILPQPIKIPAVRGLGNSLASLGQLLGGAKDYYEPVVVGPISIHVNPPDAASTTYTATITGAGMFLGDFDKMTKVQQDGWWEVAVQTILFDFLCPAIAGILIPEYNKTINAFVDFVGAGGVLKDIINAIAASNDIRAKAQSGKFPDACWDALLLIVKTDTLKNVFLQVFGDFLNSLASPNAWFGLNGTLLIPGKKEKLLAQSSKKLLDYISLVNVGIQMFDTMVQGLELSSCDSANIFTLEVTNAIARLNPDKAMADANLDPIVFTASVTNADLAPDALLVYQWSCACKFGDISDGVKTNSSVGNTFFSNSKVLSYVPNGKGKPGDVETVTVQIFKGPFNKRVAIGTASSPITFSPGKPKGITEAAGTLVFTKQYPDGRIVVIAFYTFSAVQNANQYDLSQIDANIPYAMGTLTRADYDKGAPVVDTGRTTGLSTFIPYGETHFYNLGGGLIGFYMYPFGPIGNYLYLGSNEQFQHNGAVQSVSDPATVTIT